MLRVAARVRARAPAADGRVDETQRPSYKWEQLKKENFEKISDRSKRPQLQDNSVRSNETLHFVMKHPQLDQIEQKSE